MEAHCSVEKLFSSETTIHSTDNNETNQLSLSRFERGIILGVGGYGKVVLAKEKKTKLLCALKVINKAKIQQSRQKQIYYELSIHSKMKHRNIIQLYSYFYDDVNIHMVLEYAQKGNLQDLMNEKLNRRFFESEIGKYIHNIASALHYCHKHNVLHGDLKPENILIDARDNAKLADFGNAWYNHCTDGRPWGGTLEYMAPELLTGKSYYEKIDNWSLGVLVYELLVGKNPFSSKRRPLTEKKICKADIKFPSFISAMAKSFIENLIVLDPYKRLSIQNVLSHSWVIDNYIVDYRLLF